MKNNTKKALLVSTVSGFVPQFEMNSVELLQKEGYEVHYATNYDYPFYGDDNHRLDNTGIIRHQVDFARSPYSKKTLIAYKQLYKLMKIEKYDMVHCHTPIGGILARLAAKKAKVPTVIYTAHGFHFFKGAPFINWLLYYTAEKFMAHYTDILITINKEDFCNANKFKLKKNGKVYLVAGVGIDTKRFSEITCDTIKKRSQLGIEENDFVILSVGELNKNKNHETIIRALSNIKHEDIVYLICGKGDYEEHLRKLIKELALENTVKLLGFRDDISEICHMSDLFVFPSFREGLPVSLMEAMATGLPVLASKVRGNVDLISEDLNGYLIDPSDVNKWRQYIFSMKNNKKKLIKIGLTNKENMRIYDRYAVKSEIEQIYRNHAILK